MRSIAWALAGLVLLGACDSPGSAPTAGRPSSAPDSPAETQPTDRPTVRDDETPAMGDKAPIVVDEPVEGDEVTSPLLLAGTANVFEATVSYRIVDRGSGDKIAKGFTTATCGTGCRGDYSEKIRFRVDEPTEAVLEVFESSAEDGSPLHMVRVNLVLLP